MARRWLERARLALARAGGNVLHRGLELPERQWRGRQRPDAPSRWTQAVEEDVQRAPPGIRGEVAGGVDDRTERLLHQREVGGDDVLAQHARLVRSLEQQLDGGEDARAGARHMLGAAIGSEDEFLQSAVRALEFLPPHEELDEAVPRIGVRQGFLRQGV